MTDESIDQLRKRIKDRNMLIDILKEQIMHNERMTLWQYFLENPLRFVAPFLMGMTIGWLLR